MPPIKVNGVAYNVERSGRGKPLVLLHGFTGSSATWQPFRPRLAESSDFITLDVIGHGRTDAPLASKRYSMAHVVNDLAALLDELAVVQADWLGYSMGGRLALEFALFHPERVRSLILEGVSPGIADPTERDARCGSDNLLADRIERDGVEAFVDYWESIPLFASQRQLPPEIFEQQRLQRRVNSPIGLANSLRGMGQGTYPGRLDDLDRLPMPVLLIVGAEDSKFRAVNAEMADRLADAQIAVVPGAGHAVHLEQPDRFVNVVARFLASHRG